jgi:hypothetical protein
VIARALAWARTPSAGPAAALLAFLCAALLLRSPQYGNPVVQIDEQFYLLVGDRMLHGAIPYADLWDRKPPGLFLIYAAIRLLGGEGIVQYQVVASLFAGATAWVIALLARRIAPPSAGWFAGAIYLIFLMANGGDGGQAPVFYNLPVAGAAWALVRVIERERFDRTTFAFGCAAMALIGVAMQIKYSVLGEGLYFGLSLIAIAFTRGLGLPRLIGAILLWVAIALLPTLLAYLWFAAAGQSEAFLFTNFQSIFLRSSPTGAEITGRLVKILGRIWPLLLAASAGGWMTRGTGGVQRFVTGWAIAALLSFFAFGTYHDHYALTLVAPLTLAAAPLYGRLWKLPRGVRIAPVGVALALAGLITAWVVISDARHRRGTDGEIRKMVAVIKPQLDDCLFVFSGDPILYHLTGSCLPTRYNFPTLLSDWRDADSIGIDPKAELARIMAKHPRFVVTREIYTDSNRATWAYLQPILAHDYQLVFTQNIGLRRQLIYRRRDNLAGGH